MAKPVGDLRNKRSPN